MPDMIIYDNNKYQCAKTNYGFIGDRFEFKIGEERFLARFRSSNLVEHILKVDKSESPKWLKLVHPRECQYSSTSTSLDQDSYKTKALVIQNISKLMPLSKAIKKYQSPGIPDQLRTIKLLFKAAVKALDIYVHMPEKNCLVLQFPESIAVDPVCQIFLLDAQLRSPLQSEEQKTRGLKWFGPERDGGIAASREEAKQLHKRALARFFCEVLRSGNCRGFEAFIEELEELCGDFDNWYPDSVFDETSQIRHKVIPVAKPAQALVPSKPRIVEKEANLNLNLEDEEMRWRNRFFVATIPLLLAVILLIGVAWFGRPIGGAQGGDGGGIDQGHGPVIGKDDAVLNYSSYIVVFPREGSRDIVEPELKSLFPKRLYDLGQMDSEKFLKDRLSNSLKTIRGLDKLKDVLARLEKMHEIRFYGNKIGLDSVIKAGALFDVRAKSNINVKYGSLLAKDSFEFIVTKMADI